MSLADIILGNYKKVSDRLGLVLEEGRLHGTVDGVPIQVWFTAHSTHIAAFLPAPASMSFQLVTTGLLDKISDFFGGGHTSLGDAELDKLFSVKAADAARVAALFNPDARKALLDVAKRDLHPAVDAHSIQLRRFSQGGLADSEDMIESDFRTAAALAKVVGASFAKPYR